MASSNAQLLLFVIVGKNEPLYEAEFHKSGTAGSSDSVTRQNYFVLHSSLDLVDKAAWTTNSMYLKVVDKVRCKLCTLLNQEDWRFQNSFVRFDLQVNQQQVSTFLTAGHIKFMLLHGGKSEDTIRNFFNEVYELYVKVSP
jgi:hypothetical protein